MGYYQGIVCENAHRVARRVFNNPAAKTEFCPQCGAKAHSACPKCGAAVRGGEVPSTSEGRFAAKADDISWPTPWYCFSCGEPYPWTAKKIAATEAVVEEFDGLTEFEKEGLKVTIADLLVETPNSDVAVIRWKKAAGKLTGVVRDVAVKVISDITSAALKDKMGLH